jgi:MFS family permease
LSGHPLISTLKSLRGNPRAVVFTEPIFGIPFNLYAPYVSVFMLSLGVSDSQIGLIASISLALQVFSALLSGAITDKLGRRRTTFIFDILSWSVPCLIWMVAQNFWFFLAAAVINSMWRITMNSFSLLLVEDADPEQMVYIYGWIYIAGMLVAFFAPIAGVLVNRYSLVPTVRGLFLFALVVMTIKFFLLFHYSTETRQGKVRMEQSKNEPFFAVLKGYHGVITMILKSPRMLYTLGVMLVLGIILMVNNNFWSIIVTTHLKFPPAFLAAFSFVKSSVELVMFFVVMPRLTSRRFKTPLLLGFGTFILSQTILISMPAQNYALLVLSSALEACSLALLRPVLDTLVVFAVDPAERSRIMAILSMAVLSLTSPFGWIAGRLSEVNRVLPFAMNLILCALGAWLVTRVAREVKRSDAAAEAALDSRDHRRPLRPTGE